jgi:two-component system response regulator YesN
MIRKIKIDIVLSDICMPGMNGLEFLNYLHLHWPYCKFIFLTGFNDFEYIQSALRNEVVDFILKLRGKRIVGADLVELAPHYDASGISTAAACKLLREVALAISVGHS